MPVLHDLHNIHHYAVLLAIRSALLSMHDEQVRLPADSEQAAHAVPPQSGRRSVTDQVGNPVTDNLPAREIPDEQQPLSAILISAPPG